MCLSSSTVRPRERSSATKSSAGGGGEGEGEGGGEGEAGSSARASDTRGGASGNMTSVSSHTPSAHAGISRSRDGGGSMPALHTTARLLPKVRACRTRKAPAAYESRGDCLSHAGHPGGAGDDVTKRGATSRRAPGTRGAKVQGTGATAPPRPFEPGRAEPPLPITDDLEAFVVPPLRGKAHPPAEMDEATPTLDDENRNYHHHPSDAGTTEFGFDPDAADAAADLAGELGRHLPHRRHLRRGHERRDDEPRRAGGERPAPGAGRRGRADGAVARAGPPPPSPQRPPLIGGD